MLKKIDFIDIKDKRLKKASVNSLLMIVIRGVSILTSMLYVPLLLNALTPSAYGVWLTITSLVSWIALCDIGLGNGLRNRLAEAMAKDEVELAKKYVSTAYATIFLLVLLLLLIFFSFYNFIPWYELLGAKDSIEKIDTLVLIVFVAFGVNFAFSLITAIINASQLPAVSTAISTMGQLCSFIIVFILVKCLGINDLWVLGGVISIVPPMVLLLSSIMLFNTKFKHIVPCWSFVDMRYAKDIMSLGIKFFILQVITIILYQSNNLIITHTVDSSAVAEYNIAYKYMTLPLMFFNIIVTPMWSATTDAYARGEIGWIKGISVKMVKVATGFTGICLVMLLAAKWVLDLWLQSDEMEVHFSTLCILGVYAVAMMFYGAYGYIINGIGKLKAQMLFTSISALLYVPLAILAGKLFGMNGVLMIFALVTIVNVIWSKIQLSMIINGTAKGIWNK